MIATLSQMHLPTPLPGSKSFYHKVLQFFPRQLQRLLALASKTRVKTSQRKSMWFRGM